MKYKLLLVAIFGTLIGYGLTTMLILPSLSFLEYFGIEIIITIMHYLYNVAKEKEVVNN